MEERVLAFANKLRAHANVFSEPGAIEWRFSPATISYEDAVSEMEDRAAMIYAAEAPELIWLLEHPPLYTAGTSARDADLLDPTRFPVYPTGRGGQYTYHGPGQLVAYVLLDLNKRGRDVRCHVKRLEAWVIEALGDYGVPGERREGRPGIWVRTEEQDAKIAAIGVRVRRWVTYHGVAINICPDLSHFAGIVPCGISGAGVTSLAALRKIESAESRPAMTT
jgi:lipoyl(octanoyl) transferase